MKGQQRIDEFALILIGVFIFMGILLITWTTPSEFPPKVEPISVSLTLQAGSSSSVDLNISGKITNVNLTASGSVSSWIKFSKNSFDVVGGSVFVTATISVPKNTAAGTYRGSIIVQSTGGSKSVPVTVEVTQISRIASRSISLGDFIVDYISGTSVVESKEGISVWKGYFYKKDFDMTANVDEKDLAILKSAEIRLVIEEANSYGNLIVTFNGQEIYSNKATAGEVSIPIDKSLVKNTNTIKVAASDPGFFFWANTVYNIKVLKFSINREGAFSKDVDFTLNSDEATNFDHAQLTFRVKDYSTPLPELEIAINGQRIFFAVPEAGFFNRNFATDVFGNKLQLSNSNKLSFKFNRQAFYDIGNVVLTIFYGV